MENTRIGKHEAIAFIFTIMVNHAILNITKIIISSTSSSALLNTVYIGIIAIFLSYIICRLLNKFPTFDILDISKFLGGKLLKAITGIMFLAYFIFFTATLLKSFSYYLQTIYFTSTNTFFIILIFLLSAVFVCNLKNNSLLRSNLLTIPLVILSVIVLFLGNAGDFVFENIFPLLGNGINETFFMGISNLYAFQGLLYLLFLPPHLKDVTILKKISLLSIIFSALYLLFSVAIVLFLFDTTVTSTLLMPLYSAARFIEFGTFFQRLDSIFILIWIISFVSFLSIVISTCNNILRKTTHLSSTKFSSSLVAFLMLVATFFSNSYAISTSLTETAYKYAFFIVLSISIIILCLAFIIKSIKNKRLSTTFRAKSLRGG